MNANDFETVLRAQQGSRTMRKAWLEAYREDFPKEADPLSFVTNSDLSTIVNTLDIQRHGILVDIGCGVGGPGVHVAEACEATLIGIDQSAGAIELARQRHLKSLPPGSDFRVGDFANSGLASGCAHGIMSTDALLFASNLTATFNECYRILKPQGRFVATTFELQRESHSLGVGPILDYRPPLYGAGFEIEEYKETCNWLQRMQIVISFLLKERDDLVAELGPAAASLVLRWAERRPAELQYSRRVLFVARRD